MDDDDAPDNRLDFLLSGRDEKGDFTKLDPLAQRFIEFDWAELYRLCGENSDSPPERNEAMIGVHINLILAWMVEGKDVKRIGHRAVLLATVLGVPVPKHGRK